MYTDFDAIQKVLEKNLAIYVESQSAHEQYQSLFHAQMESHSALTDVMSKIQTLIYDEFSSTSDERQLGCFDKTLDEIHSIQQVSSHQLQYSKSIYSTSKNLKKIQELITVTKSLINSIIERKKLVKEYVLISSQQRHLQRQLDDPNSSGTSMSKIQLSQQIQTIQAQMKTIKQEIALKYNINILQGLKKIEAEQEQKVLHFVSALSQSQAQIHSNHPIQNLKYADVKHVPLVAN